MYFFFRKGLRKKLLKLSLLFLKGYYNKGVGKSKFLIII